MSIAEETSSEPTYPCVGNAGVTLWYIALLTLYPIPCPSKARETAAEWRRACSGTPVQAGSSKGLPDGKRHFTAM